MRKSREESLLQEAAVAFIKRALPGVPVWSVDCVWPNDGSEWARNILMSRRRRGILSGYPDVIVWLSPVVTFELKRAKGGSLSDAQLARRDELIRALHHWFGPITALEQIEAAFVSLGVKLAATTGIVVPVPKVGVRREANYAKLNDPVPDMSKR